MNGKLIARQIALQMCLIVPGIIVSGSSVAQSNSKTCEKIKHLYVSGHAKEYSVSSEETEPDYGEFKFSFNHSGEEDVVGAGCGHGSDAICEMTLTRDNKKAFDFSLGATIRFLDLDGKIYIVNGVTEHANGRVSFEGYEVHQLFPSHLELICSTN